MTNPSEKATAAVRPDAQSRRSVRERVGLDAGRSGGSHDAPHAINIVSMLREEPEASDSRVGRYGKRADLIVHEEEPFNAETPPAALAEGPLTATDAFYVRGHGAVPEIDSAVWRVRVHGLVERELDLSLTTLREAFRERTETATLQCAGNRRAGLIGVRDIPGEAPWGPGATGTATWPGVALADVLALAGPLGDAAHVGFEGADVSHEAEPIQRFGGSIPLDKACRPEVILAWAMNGDPLPRVHGAPLRVVVPGYIGARSVKWLERNAASLHIPALMLASGQLHPREAIQYLTHAVLDAVGGELRDDATSLCFDWHGGAQGDRVSHAGAEHRTQRDRQ